MGKRAGIIQSNYIPWKGYFDFIDSVDEFVLFDDVQYTRRDWRNRNLVKTANGLQWLTIPIDVKGKYTQLVREARVTSGDWAPLHLRSLQHAYGRAPHFAEYDEWLTQLYAQAADLEYLSEINALFIDALCRAFRIDTPLRRSSEFAIVDGKNERLISLCRQVGADEYLSGPAARDYLDLERWRQAGIAVFFKSYQGYPEYPQLHGAFEHGVSALDLLFHTGTRAREYLKSAIDVEQ
ncbi:MAG TPA: WbqC family protein [Candidatus Baltobacteraceae bacterium]|nr:WbqC family protein [Candidatus Baltobacteraceae bacterium]